MSSTLKKYFDQSIGVTRRMLQARVEIKLIDEANEIRRQQGISWQELIEGLLKFYIDETKKEKKS